MSSVSSSFTVPTNAGSTPSRIDDWRTQVKALDTDSQESTSRASKPRSTPRSRSSAGHIVDGENFEDRGIEDDDFVSKKGDADIFRKNKQV